MFEPSGWEERYSGEEKIWSGEPNPQLVAEVSGLTPGTALDVGCGEGGDVIWLARQGWRVTGADFSANGLARAARHAEEAGVADRTDWWQVDARTFAADGRSFDLVTTHFLHPPDGGMVDGDEPAGRGGRARRAPPGGGPRAVRGVHAAERQPAQSDVPRRGPAARPARRLRGPRGRAAATDDDPRRRDGRHRRLDTARPAYDVEGEVALIGAISVSG